MTDPLLLQTLAEMKEDIRWIKMHMASTEKADAQWKTKVETSAKVSSAIVSTIIVSLFCILQLILRK